MTSMTALLRMLDTMGALWSQGRQHSRQSCHQRRCFLSFTASEAYQTMLCSILHQTAHGPAGSALVLPIKAALYNHGTQHSWHTRHG